MTKIVRMWRTMSFWDKLEKSFGVVGAITVMEMGREEAPYWAFIVVGAFGLLAKLTHIWIEDKNNNGIADILEKHNEV